MTNSLLNYRLMEEITFDDVLHGFQVSRGMGTPAFEANLLQQLTAMRDAVLFKVLLDIHKAYDALYRERCLVIIATYRVGPRKIRPLRTYWGHLTMMDRDGRYFGLMFKGCRGVTQVEPLPTTIFNVVVDAVIRHWVAVMVSNEDGMEGLGLSIQD